MIGYELLTDTGFNSCSLDTFERTHAVKRVYRRKGGEYVLKELPYTEKWNLSQKRELAARIAGEDHVTRLALEDGRVIGFAALKKRLAGRYMILDEMHVSAEHRGRGIGRALFESAREEARRAGAEALYISACSSEETVAFYRAMGAELCAEPIRELAEAEPFDLQLVCELKGGRGATGGTAAQPERWDLYDRYRIRTGRTMERGAAFEPDAYHLVVHVIVFGTDGRMLIQRRQPFKQGWPDLWDVSVGGSALAGEDPPTAAARELYEELGIRAELSGVRPKLTVNFDNGFDDFFLITRDVDLKELRLQPEEVQDAKWATREEILAMIADGSFIPYHPSLIGLLFDSRFKYGCQSR